MSISYDLDCLVHSTEVQQNFGTNLLKLIFKADLENRERLRLGFPKHVRAVEHYEATGNVGDGEGEEQCLNTSATRENRIGGQAH